MGFGEVVVDCRSVTAGVAAAEFPPLGVTCIPLPALRQFSLDTPAI